MKRLFSIFSLICTVFFACGQKTYEEKLESLYRKTVPLIDSDSLKEKLGSPDTYVIDTRSKEEYQVSHIAGAQFLDYNNHSKKDFKHIPKDADVIVYCTVGYRSERVGEELQRLGFTNVKNLYGGIFEWKNQENGVVNEHNAPTDSVHTYSESWSKWLDKGIKVF